MSRAVRVTFFECLYKNVPARIMPGGLRPHAIAGPLTSEPIQLCFIGATICVERDIQSIQVFVLT